MKRKKIISIILTMAIIITSLNIGNVMANTAVETFSFVGKDGNVYTVEAVPNVTGEYFNIEICSKDAGVKYKFEYEDGYLEKTESERAYSVLGIDVYKKTVDNEYDITEYQDEKALAQAYSSKTECVLPTAAGNHLKYWTGQTGQDVGYSKIACKATYRVKNSKNYVQEFKDKVKSSNRNLQKSGFSSAAAVAGALAVYGLLAIASEGAIILILEVVVGGGTIASIGCLYAAICDEVDAHEFFDQAKAYGKKI